MSDTKLKNSNIKLARPLQSHDVTYKKLKNLKIAIICFYASLPIVILGFIIFGILDDNHPIADDLRYVLPWLGVFFVMLGSVIPIVSSPIYRRLMRVVGGLDEGEQFLQQQSYKFAYRTLFRATLIIAPIGILISQLSSLLPKFMDFRLPLVAGGFVPMMCLITLLFSLIAVVLLPMVYLAWNLKPIDNED